MRISAASRFGKAQTEESPFQSVSSAPSHQNYPAKVEQPFERPTVERYTERPTVERFTERPTVEHCAERPTVEKKAERPTVQRCMPTRPERREDPDY